MAENVVVAVGDFIVRDRGWTFDVKRVLKVTEKMVTYDDGDPGGARVPRDKIMFAGPEEIAKHLAEQAAPVLLAAYPALEGAQAEAEAVTSANHDNFLAKMIAHYGEKLAVPKLNADQHERIDPISELVEKVHPSKIIAVSP